MIFCFEKSIFFGCIHCKDNRPIRLTKCCTQFKPFGDKTFFSGISISFKCECNIIMQDLNWVQHWVSRIGLSVVLDRSPPKHSNQENWSSTHFYWFKSPTWSRKSLSGEVWTPVQAPNMASNHGTIVEMSVFKGFKLWSLSELIVLFRRCRRVKQWEENIALFSQVREPLKKGSSLFHRQPKRTICGFGLQRSFGGNIQELLVYYLTPNKCKKS